MAGRRVEGRWRVLAAVVGALALAVLVASGLRFMRHRTATQSELRGIAAIPSASASAAEPTATPSAASADPLPSSAPAVSSGGGAGATPPKPFDRASAQAALDALAPDLAQCKLPRGSTCQVRVTYAPDGHIQSAVPLRRCDGAAAGACIAARLKTANVDPFVGRPTAYVYTYVARAH